MFNAHELGCLPVIHADPLTIRCGDFFVGGTSWVRYRKRVPNLRMCDLIASRYRRMRRRESYLKNFFATRDLVMVVNRKRLRHRLRRVEGVPYTGTSGLRTPKEEPADENLEDFGVRRYNFYYGLYDDMAYDQ
jgi:hypothetical protein